MDGVDAAEWRVRFNVLIERAAEEAAASEADGVDKHAARMYTKASQERGPAWGQVGQDMRATWRNNALYDLLGDIA